MSQRRKICEKTEAAAATEQQKKGVCTRRMENPNALDALVPVLASCPAGRRSRGQLAPSEVRKSLLRLSSLEKYSMYIVTVMY